MADSCENIPQSSPDRQVNLVRSYCDAYDQMSKEELPKLTGKAKIDKLNEMAGVLRQIEEMQKSRNQNGVGYGTQRIEITQGLSASPQRIQVGFLNQSSIGIVESDRRVNSIPGLTPGQRANGVMSLLENSGTSYYFSAGKWGGRILGQLISFSTESEDGNEPSSNDLILQEGMSKKLLLEFINPGQPDRRNKFLKKFEISYQNGSLSINEEGQNLKSFEHIDVETLRKNHGIIRIILGNGADNEGHGKRTVLFLKIAGIQ